MPRRPLSAILLLTLLFTSTFTFAQKPITTKPAATRSTDSQVQKQSAPPPVIKRLDQVVQEEVTAKTFMGAVLVAKGDGLLLSKGYGSANLEWNIPNSPTTKFRLGSLGKQFTAAAILLMEERGQLSVTDPVKKHLPDAPAAWDAITLHHLLSHTSGIPNLTNTQQFPDYYATMATKATPEQLIARFRDKPLDFAPGERFQYSNSGYIVLGHILEKITGKSYAQFMEENVFAPLGMKNTGMDTPDKVLANRAAGYVPGPGGLTNAPFIHMSIPFAAGAFYSTTEDLLQWQQGLAGGKLLKPESFAKMTTPNKGGYAYGVFARPMGAYKALSHGGGIEGFNTFMVYYPESKITVIVLGNVNGQAPQTIARNLGAVAHGETIKLASERIVAVPTKLLAEYVGTYRFAPDFAMVVTLEGDQLMTQATGQGKAPIFPESETTFFPKVVEAKIEFVRDAAGKVTTLVLHQGGRQMKAARE